MSNRWNFEWQLYLGCMSEQFANDRSCIAGTAERAWALLVSWFLESEVFRLSRVATWEFGNSLTWVIASNTRDASDWLTWFLVGLEVALVGQWYCGVNARHHLDWSLLFVFCLLEWYWLLGYVIQNLRLVTTVAVFLFFSLDASYRMWSLCILLLHLFMVNFLTYYSHCHSALLFVLLNRLAFQFECGDVGYPLHHRRCIVRSVLQKSLLEVIRRVSVRITVFGWS